MDNSSSVSFTFKPGARNVLTHLKVTWSPTQKDFVLATSQIVHTPGL